MRFLQAIPFFIKFWHQGVNLPSTRQHTQRKHLISLYFPMVFDFNKSHVQQTLQKNPISTINFCLQSFEILWYECHLFCKTLLLDYTFDTSTPLIFLREALPIDFFTIPGNLCDILIGMASICNCCRFYHEINAIRLCFWTSNSFKSHFEHLHMKTEIFHSKSWWQLMDHDTQTIS